MAQDEEQRQTDEEREEGHRRATSDRALVRLDEKEIKARMMDAFDEFIKRGFATHMIGVQARAAIEYTLMLYPDGVDAVPSELLQELADKFRLDYTIERGPSYEGGWAIVLYPRW